MQHFAVWTKQRRKNARTWQHCSRHTRLPIACMYVCVHVCEFAYGDQFLFSFFPNQRWMLFVASSSSSGCAFALFYMASTEQIETRFTSWRSCCCRAHSHSRTYTLKKNLCNHSSTLILRVFRLAFHFTSLSFFLSCSFSNIINQN